MTLLHIFTEINDLYIWLIPNGRFSTTEKGFYTKYWLRGMLKSSEHEIYPAHKCLNASNC